MRWDELFAELEAEFLAAEREETDAEIVEMVQAELATISFVDRIRGRVGEPITVRLRNGENRSGVLHEANLAWLMLHEGGRRFLIPYHGVAFAWPLGGAAPELAGVAARLTLGYALRTLAGSGLEVHVFSEGGELRGRIGRVGADSCDIHAQTTVITVPWRAILSIES